MTMTEINIETDFDPATSTLTYVVWDPQSRDAVIIDPVLDYDAAAVAISQETLTKLMHRVNKLQLNVHFILETHAHADHLSSAHEIHERHLPKAIIGIGARITEVQQTFKTIFNLAPDFRTDGSQFGRLFYDNETVNAGTLNFRIIATPGHTPACVSYLFSGAVFTGDALFMPDSGTGRCDFPGGNAAQLYDSVHNRLYNLPGDTRVYVGHDYQPNGRELQYQTTIGACKRENIQLRKETTAEEYIAFRRKRDATLSAPKLLYPSIQTNIAAGELPEAESNGCRYLKLPLTLVEKASS